VLEPDDRDRTSRRALAPPISPPLISRRPVFLLVAVLLAAAKLVPRPPNVTPDFAVALFGGAAFADRRPAFLVQLTSARALSEWLVRAIRERQPFGTLSPATWLKNT
jgi:hypothetical protein